MMQKQYLTTDEFAAEIGIKPGTLTKAKSKDGHYFGVTPLKGLNGRLSWPADAVAKLKGGAA